MKEFMTVMSVAHEVVSEDPTKLSEEEDGENDFEVDPKKLLYQGPSPDEVTLVEFARERGFCFIMSNDSVVRMRVNDPTQSVASIAQRQSDLLVVREQEMEFDQNNKSIPKRI